MFWKLQSFVIFSCRSNGLAALGFTIFGFPASCFWLVSWESEATPSATPFFKRAYKISHPPRLWVSWIDLPSFASSLKIWPKFSNKVFFSWSYEKVILTKNVRITYYSSMKKKIQKDSDDFWHRKFTLKVQFSHFVPSWQS